MAISSELRQQWVYAKDDVKEYEALILYHPNFSDISDNGYFFMVNYPEDMNLKPFESDGDDTEHLFKSTPFAIQYPEVGEVQQDIKIALPNYGGGSDGTINVRYEILYALQQPTIPIKARYQIYMDGFDTPQGDFGWLDLTEIVLENDVANGVIKRQDLYDYVVGEKVVYDDRYEGLFI